MHREDCPADPIETDEAFVLNRMDARDATVYHEHLALCKVCTERVEKTREFAQAIRSVSRELLNRDKEPT